MTISLHSHSGQFCSHAVGTLEEVVQQAIRQGFSTFGLSEHIPRYRRQDLYPEEVELGVEALAVKFEEYIVEAHRLKSFYAPQIKLLVGIETEYINEEGLGLLEQLLERHGDLIQYLVGSVHHCSERPIDFDKAQFNSLLATLDGASSTDRFSQLFEIYFDNQLKLMQRLKPAVIGHFDLCRLYYPELDFRSFPVVWEKIRRNVEYAQNYGALFEINSSAFRKGWTTAYPGAEVFDGRFTLSDDSHGPLAVGLHYDKLYGYLRDRKVEEVWVLSEEVNKGKKVVPMKVEGTPWLDEWVSMLSI